MTALIGAFLAVEDPLKSCIAGIAVFKAAAFNSAEEALYPGSFHVEIYDWLYRVDGDTVRDVVRVLWLDLRKSLRLIAITDKGLKPNIIRAVEDSLRGGAISIQLRLKGAPTREMIELGRGVRRVMRAYNTLYFVDDRLDVALATDADGIQLGPEDIRIWIVREIAPNLIIGGSVYSLEEALEVEEEDAHFLSAGSVFLTPSKPDARVIGIEGLKRIVECVKIPVVAIGGINKDNARQILRTGVVGTAVISAIMGAEEVYRAALKLRKTVDEVLGYVG